MAQLSSAVLEKAHGQGQHPELEHRVQLSDGLSSVRLECSAPSLSELSRLM